MLQALNLYKKTIKLNLFLGTLKSVDSKLDYWSQSLRVPSCTRTLKKLRKTTCIHMSCNMNMALDVFWKYFHLFNFYFFLECLVAALKIFRVKLLFVSTSKMKSFVLAGLPTTDYVCRILWHIRILRGSLISSIFVVLPVLAISKLQIQHKNIYKFISQKVHFYPYFEIKIRY